MLASGTRVRGFKPDRSVGFFGHLKNPPHAFLRWGSERICPMSQLCSMYKNLVPPRITNVLAKFLVYFPPSLAEVSRAYVVRGASGDE